jgi:hypothetical protein
VEIKFKIGVKENIRSNPQAKHMKAGSRIINFRDKAP